MTTTGKSCDCGCGATTTTTPGGVQRDYIQNHNRRGTGNGWIEGGYRFLRVNGRKIAEHRHMMELMLGRKLRSDEIVHHVDWNRLNNDPDNLVIL